jgi:ABC-type sugar transport system ATPase subunit
MAGVTVENVTVVAGHRSVLDGVSFEVPDAGLLVLVGPSGCGKTMLLRVIAGLTRPARGHVYIGGARMDAAAPGDRDIAMCFQTYALYPNMTVGENWAFPLRAVRMPEAEIRRRVTHMAQVLHMEPLLHRYPRELSGGQQQRVALGRALVRTPRLYLLDEPFGNLDAKLRVELRAVIKKLQMDRGITTVHVTHDQVEAQALGDRLVVLDRGVVQQVGTPEQVYEAPANLFVGGFVGSPRMNFIPAAPAAEDGRLLLQHPRFRLPLPPAKADAVRAASLPEGVVLGVRPEAIELSPVPAEGIPAQIYVLEPQSNELIVDLKFDGMILKARVQQDGLRFRPAVNQQVAMIFSPELVHVFDPRTGRRVA